MARGVYLIGNVKHRFFKVGRTTDLRKRLKDMGTDCPFELQTFHFWETEEYIALEAYLHDFLKKRHTHLRNEWFRLTPTDIRLCNQEAVKFLANPGASIVSFLVS